MTQFRLTTIELGALGYQHREGRRRWHAVSVSVRAAGAARFRGGCGCGGGGGGNRHTRLSRNAEDLLARRLAVLEVVFLQAHRNVCMGSKRNRKSGH